MNVVWREQWEREGYLVVPGVFEPARAERLRRICDDILEQWNRRDPQSGKPNANPDAHCMRHLNHPEYFRDRPPAHFAELMDAVADELVLGIARAILGEPALFRCTSLFMNPRGSSQDGNWHRDIQFQYRDEAEERRVLEDHLQRKVSAIQMQIALVASADIEFVPGSHRRWDTPEEYAIRCADGRAHNRSNRMPGALRIEQQPGDAVLFNPDGHHRGRYHTDKPRRTLMLTYTKASEPRADYFTDQPWFLEKGYLDPLSPRTRSFFEPFVAAFQAFWLEKSRGLQPA